MTFGMLASLNLSWHDRDTICILDQSETALTSLPDDIMVRAAKTLYGDYKVVWFQDNLVAVQE